MRFRAGTPAPRLVAGLLLGIGLVLGAGCEKVGPSSDPAAEDLEQIGAAVATAELGAAGPGALISAHYARPLLPPGALLPAHAARVVYRSTNGDTGRQTQVSGSVFTPAGQPPAGGWPVIAYAHGNSGINPSCAPSLSDTYGGFADTLASFLGSGFAVSMTDYQGLGEGPAHPFLDAKTEGLNLIDGVRALRATFPHVSAQWAVIGGSQGGGASWGAAEQAGTYAPDLDLVGAVALSPPADMAGLVDKAVAGTMTREQIPVLQGLVESLARIHPSLDRDDYRSRGAARDWEVLSACDGELRTERDSAVRRLGPDSLRPKNPAAADRLREYLSAWALPQQPLEAPLFVVYSSKDPYVDTEWTTAAIQRACELGGTVRWRLETDHGHADLEIADQVRWLVNRFEGRPSRSDCPE